VVFANLGRWAEVFLSDGSFWSGIIQTILILYNNENTENTIQEE